MRTVLETLAPNEPTQKHRQDLKLHDYCLGTFGQEVLHVLPVDNGLKVEVGAVGGVKEDRTYAADCLAAGPRPEGAVGQEDRALVVG